MTFSSKNKIPLSFIGSLKKVLNKDGLTLKNKKTIKYGKNDYKIVTGIVISPNNKILLHNKHKRKAISKLKQLDDNNNASILGLIAYAKSIEDGFLENIERKLKTKLTTNNKNTI